MEDSTIIETQEGQAINFRDILRKCFRYWHWFVVGLLLALTGAFIYTLYSTPVYETDAAVLIKDNKGFGDAGALQDDIIGQLSMLTGNSNVQNEMAIISSRTIVAKTVSDLGLQTAYFVPERFRDQKYIVRLQF